MECAVYGGNALPLSMWQCAEAVAGIYYTYVCMCDAHLRLATWEMRANNVHNNDDDER